ncbi:MULTISPECIES: hypothetical protein [unclassified Staphylococcus]|nr:MULTISPECIES: hypothetical protein [unclassified Staphylococcus]MBF2758415.1 hypothetical protein [Staphylococcus haemolyticus]MBF2774814.1 hypothetical protein [Staphylococcus haemolyticus]MBF2777101.1 hypothetical protein [Staphylococcus haemolyticus]MBF2816695.1 hypothetical protein [Staphylococcus haemolyticus]MBF9721230.1 hypothetical protein [Staphylococcus haemolyticus]
MIKLDHDAKKLARKALLKPKFLRTHVENVIITMIKREVYCKGSKKKIF